MNLRILAIGVLALALAALTWAGVQLLSPEADLPTSPEEIRRQLFAEIQPVTLKNCALQRFGEANDGGYLLCGDLLSGVQSAYSYGISGYDGWGCEVSRRLHVPVHEYDCFDTKLPACAGVTLEFHPECVGPTKTINDGREFDTVQNQIARNGDSRRRLVVKMDIEWAEWDSLSATPRRVLDQFAQFAIEFHGIDERRFLQVVRKLKELFYVAHLHFNNYRCGKGAEPFPADVYEVLFVNKRLAEVDSTRPPMLPHPLDAPNNPKAPDCQGERP